MDVSKSIRLCVDSGKVKLGSKNALKLALRGEPKLLIVAANTPRETVNDVKKAALDSGVPVLDFAGTGLDLGRACGKPFIVSVLAVLEAGDSDILQAVNK
jgi:large subunit ribosomal protein L30e